MAQSRISNEVCSFVDRSIDSHLSGDYSAVQESKIKDDKIFSLLYNIEDSLKEANFIRDNIKKLSNIDILSNTINTIIDQHGEESIIVISELVNKLLENTNYHAIIKSKKTIYQTKSKLLVNLNSGYDYQKNQSLNFPKLMSLNQERLRAKTLKMLDAANKEWCTDSSFKHRYELPSKFNNIKLAASSMRKRSS